MEDDDDASFPFWLDSGMELAKQHSLLTTGPAVQDVVDTSQLFQAPIGCFIPLETTTTEPSGEPSKLTKPGDPSQEKMRRGTGDRMPQAGEEKKWQLPGPDSLPQASGVLGNRKPRVVPRDWFPRGKIEETYITGLYPELKNKKVEIERRLKELQMEQGEAQAEAKSMLHHYALLAAQQVNLQDKNGDKIQHLSDLATGMHVGQENWAPRMWHVMYGMWDFNKNLFPAIVAKVMERRNVSYQALPEKPQPQPGVSPEKTPTGRRKKDPPPPDCYRELVTHMRHNFWNKVNQQIAAKNGKKTLSKSRPKVQNSKGKLVQAERRALGVYYSSFLRLPPTKKTPNTKAQAATPHEPKGQGTRKVTPEKADVMAIQDATEKVTPPPAVLVTM